MNGDAFIQLAGRIATQSHADEAAFRTAVSRAYYGAFHVARQFLEDLGIRSVANAQAHGFVRHCLIGSGDAALQQAGSLLSTLHSDRIQADYRLHMRRFNRLAAVRGSIESADRIRSILEQCLTSGAADTVRVSIEECVRRRGSS